MAEAFKEQDRRLGYSSLGLLSVVTSGTAMLGVTTASAQIMGRELVAPSYECEDEEFGDYVSSFPCDETVDVCPCPYCDETFPCDNLESHESLIHADKDEWPLEPENPWENEEYPWDGNANTGNGNGHTGSGNTGGNGSWNSGESSLYASGKSVVSKMETDVKNGNYQIYEAEIIDDEGSPVVDFVSETTLASDVTDYVAHEMFNFKNTANYTKIAKALSNIGFAIDAAQTVVIIATKSPSEYTT